MDADLTGYTPPLSLWKLVELHVAEHERDELKSLLGSGQVEEALELHEELQTLLEIWRDCRNHSQPMQKSLRLPEPPGMRERLTQEIVFFIENIREKAQKEGRDETRMLQKYDSGIIDYVENRTSSVCSTSDDIPKRPMSAIGQNGRETPTIRIGTPTSDRMSSSSVLSEDVEAISDKLNILKLDEVSQHLRLCLAEEKEHLIEDLHFLQQCIEEENSFSKQEAFHSEPTIADLRAERLKMEKDMLSDVFVLQTPAVTDKLMNNPPLNLRSVSAKTRRSPVVPSHGPVKAVHLHAPEGIVLEGQVPDSIVHKAQLIISSDRSTNHATELTGRHQLVKVGSISANQLADHVQPSSPSTGQRPSSALRFRCMIMNSRKDNG